MKLPKGVSLLESTKLEFLNFENVLHAGKRDRKHRVWGYISIIYSDSLDLLFLKNGDPFNAARMTQNSKKIVPINDVVQRAKETKLGIVSVYSVDEELIRMIITTISTNPMKKDISADKIKIPLLFKKLTEKKFNGFLHLRRGLEESFIYYDQGSIKGAYIAGNHDKIRDQNRIADLFSSIPNITIDIYEREVSDDEQASPALVEMFYSIFTKIFQNLGKALGESLVIKTAIKGRASIQKDFPFMKNVKINPDLSVSGEIMANSDQLVKAFGIWLNNLVETFTTFLGDETIKIVKDSLIDYRFVLKSAGFFKIAKIKMD